MHREGGSRGGPLRGGQVDPAGPGPGDLHVVAESGAERDAWLQQLAAAAAMPVCGAGWARKAGGGPAAPAV